VCVSYSADNGIPSCAHVNPKSSAHGVSPNFPRTGGDVDYGFYDFMFNIEFTPDFVRMPTAVRYPNRVAVAIYVEGWSEVQNEYMRFINHPYGINFIFLLLIFAIIIIPLFFSATRLLIDTCALSFFNKIVNQNFENPIGTEMTIGTDLQLNRSFVYATPYLYVQNGFW
jgi:hypothetical protein